MIRLLAPSGMPISPLRIVKASLSSIVFDSKAEFSSKLKERLKAKHCFLTNSARTGLMLILKAMAQLSESERRNEIIIPAYTCYSVAAAIVRAGLKIRTIDIDPDSFDFDYTQLAATDFDRVLAIIPSSLFGLVADFDRLRQLKVQPKPYLIDDAAQAFGSEQNHRSAGNLGDAGVISFDRGKNLTTYAGGVILSDNDQLTEIIAREYCHLPNASVGSSVSTAGKALLYSLFIRPTFFRLLASLPFLGLGETIYDSGFGMSKLGNFQSTLGRRMIADLDRFNQQRLANAASLVEQIRAESQYRVPAGISKDTICLRLPVLARNQSHRDRVIESLRRAGVVASKMYPSTIANIDSVREYLVPDISPQSEAYPGAMTVCEKMFTLPTHPMVTASDIDRIINSLREVK